MSTTTNAQRGDHRHPEAAGNGASPSGGANTMSFDYSGTYSGAITADGTQVSSDGESFDASEAGTLGDDLIDRSDFDEQMGTSTTWSMGDQGSTTQASATQASSAQATTSTQVQAEASSETSENPIIAFFQWLGSLLGF